MLPTPGSSRPDLPGAVHGRPRRDDRERRAAVDPDRSPPLGGDLQWIVNAYTLVFGGFLLLGGRLGDLLGRKRLFLIGLVIFTGASLLDGLAGSEGVLIGARALQGLGAALISPAALSIIATTFAEGAERARALAVWAAIAIGGSAVGLILGGALTQYVSWPWIFFVNVPVGIAAFVLSLRLVPESRDAHAQRSYDVAGAVTRDRRPDGPRLRHRRRRPPAGRPPGRSAFAAAAVLLVAFVAIETRAMAPLVRLSIFRVRSLLTANLRCCSRCPACSRCSSSTRSTSSAYWATGPSRPASHSSRSPAGSWSPPGLRRSSRRGSASGRWPRSGSC